MCNHSQIEKYHELMNMKKHFLLRFYVFIPLLLLFFYNAIALTSINPILINALAIILFVTSMYINMFYFFAKDNCPWCKCNFFTGEFMNVGPDFFLRKKCVNCGVPTEVIK